MNDQPGDSASSTFQSLQSLLLSSAEVSQFLDDLAGLAAGLVPGASTGITTRYRASALTVASSDTRAETLDETQYRNGTGPCLEALATGQIVECADLRTETRWPAYTAAAVQHGLRASLSLPLKSGEDTLAALNVYSFDPAVTFGPDERRRCQTFATQAAISLRLATRQERDGATLSQLEASLNSRTVIDQALGMIMMQRRCNSKEAFDLLRQQSQNNHRKLRQVAADLVANMSGQAPEPGRPFNVDQR